MTRRLIGTLCALLVSAPLGVARAQFDPDFNHLECYSIKPAQKFTRRTVTVETQFGVHTAVEVLKPIRLCLPADKTGPGVDPPPPTAVPHFLCYKVKTKTRFPADVKLTDQFGTLRERTKKPQLLCNPVVKVATTTSTTSSTTSTTTTTSTSPATTSTTTTLCPAIPPNCNASFPIPAGCPCSLNCSNCVGSVCNTLTGRCE